MKTNLSQSILKHCDEVSQVLKSLSHPVRLKILCQVMEGEKTVSELTDFCKISQSAMSQFLTRMKNEGLLSSRRDKTNMFYEIADQKLVRHLRAIREIYC